MERILKIIRSRFFISAILILLEFVQLLVVFILVNKFSTLMFILGYIFYIGVFLYIINKYESPEFKLPWIIIIMLFSVVGAFVFIVLSSNDQNKKEIIKFKKDKEKIKENLNQDDSLEILKTENRDAYLQANYITKTTDLPCYKNTKISYYKER